jgi:serine/threonine protein kinase
MRRQNPAAAPADSHWFAAVRASRTVLHLERVQNCFMIATDEHYTRACGKLQRKIIDCAKAHAAHDHCHSCPRACTFITQPLSSSTSHIFCSSCAGAFSSLWIVMELLEGGSLQELMRETETTINEPTIAWIMRDMLQVSAVFAQVVL